MNPFFNFLVASPSFLEGAARLFDFGNTLTEYNYSLDDKQADSIAIRSDWSAVGYDLAQAFEDFQRQTTEERRERIANTDR